MVVAGFVGKGDIDARPADRHGAGTVLHLDAAFSRISAAPSTTALLAVVTDSPSFTLQLFRAGPETRVTRAAVVRAGVAVTRPVTIGWRAHRNRPASVRVRIGDWASGVYFAKLVGIDGRTGYAPVIVRPRRLGAHRVAVVMPTHTWQAYNFRDDDGDGVANTWYACPTCTVRLGRPFLRSGMPPHFRRYDLPFLRWLAQRDRGADVLSDDDLERIPAAADLARAYDLIVFPGHHEYVTPHEYALLRGFRDLGGNLAFLSANNLFWRVDRHGEVLKRVARWRRLGLPEAALVGVQYRASDRGQRRGPFVIRTTRATPWLFAGTGLAPGSRLTGFGSPAGRFGIEIDMRAPSSPADTTVIAEIPHLFGRGVSAQMSYYETSAGAKVYAAGAFSMAGAALWEPVATMLENLWGHLAQP